MPRENSRFFVLNQLQELAKESDQFVELIPPISILDDYFSLVKETVLKIKTCTSVKDIEFPPDIKTVIGVKRVVKNVDITETQRAHVHAEKHVPTSEETAVIEAEKNKRSSKVIIAKDKCELQEESICILENKGFQSKSSSASLCKKSNQVSLLPQINIPETVVNGPVKIIPENSSGLSQGLMETPIMNRTFNKLMSNTVILDSTSANKSNKKLNIEGASDIRITRSSKNKLQINENIPPKLTRSGSKRKSSVSKYESSKKQKTEVDGSVSKSANKASKSKPHIKKYPSKPAPLLSFTNKMKPVITPTMKHSTSMATSKEKDIMVEIKKKEEKASKNRKKVLAERQLKVEENKKKRNEKMEQTLQKRLQIEKEKVERIEKKDIDKKAQADAPKESVKKPKPATKSRTKELVEQHMKENNHPLASKQDTTVFKTPNRKLSHNSETYDLTPAPNSSTYDYSDDEDRPSDKPIPLWAQGIQLKAALANQFFYPPNVGEIFGTRIEPPNLSEIFGCNKTIYTKRTSSAVWHSPPDRSFYI